VRERIPSAGLQQGVPTEQPAANAGRNGCGHGIASDNKQEGVIKFHLQFKTALPARQETIRELTRWRNILWRAGLLGRDPKRYGGLGFGNISRRLPPFAAVRHHRRFVVSGSQTQHLRQTNASHYAVVLEYYPEKNLLAGKGPVPPSSEAMTHGTIYDLDSSARWVIHVHSPVIWNNARRLGLPITREDALYGTPEMVSEVARLFSENQLTQKPIFAMGGHEDGLIAFGKTANETGNILLQALSDASRL
jgi:hypothetical protein